MTPTTERADLTERLAQFDELAAQRGIVLEVDAMLGPLTTLRVGGVADRLIEARTADQLVAALEVARIAGVPVGVLGKGSDIVVADAGVRGLVIRNRADALEIEDRTVRATSGVAMATLVKRCTSAGLAGVEFGISIPGSVGGAVWANAGAHGGEMKDVVVTVEAWSADAGVRTLPNGACGFAYRDSRFKASGEIVLRATIRLTDGDVESIAASVAANQAQRKSTQPLADQNAGSVFRNPPGDHAGRLIDAAGLKGFRIGSAQVSTLHANFIVVDRGGSAADVRAVGDYVRGALADATGIVLEYEIEFVGDWGTTGGWATPTGRLAGA